MDDLIEMRPWLPSDAAWFLIAIVWFLAVHKGGVDVAFLGAGLCISGGLLAIIAGPKIRIRGKQLTITSYFREVEVRSISQIKYAAYGKSRMIVVVVDKDGKSRRIVLGSLYRWGWKGWNQLIIALINAADEKTVISRQARKVLPDCG
ncbi:MAG: hypothetical protein V9F03_10475 [Microthrixaceae bacterium]